MKSPERNNSLTIFLQTMNLKKKYAEGTGNGSAGLLLGGGQSEVKNEK